MDFRGVFSITDPEERTRLYGQQDHVISYSLETLIERFGVAGCNTEMLSSLNVFPETLKDAKLGDTIVLARKL